MVFTQGPLSVGESFGVERRLLRFCFTQIETAAHHSLFVPTANLWYDIRDTYIVRFVADGCRKNLPLSAPSCWPMTLSRRNSSAITVDDVTFRWTIVARSQSDTDMVRLVVQPPEHGQRLTVEIPSRDHWLKCDEPEPEFNYRCITPSLVRKCMDMAVDLGWSPDTKGPQLSFALQPDETLLPA